MSRPDMLDEINAFRAGWRHGYDRGIVSPREAEGILRGLPLSVTPNAAMITYFCTGAEDGAHNDQFRLLLSYALRVGTAEVAS